MNWWLMVTDCGSGDADGKDVTGKEEKCVILSNVLSRWIFQLAV